MRSIQSTIEKFFDTTISFRLIEQWIKSFKKNLANDVDREKKEEEKEKPKTIKIVEIDANKYINVYKLA